MSLERLLADLVADWSPPADPAGLALAVTEVAFDLPVEARDEGQEPAAFSPPRGRMGTGFDRPLGRVRATFARGE